MKSFRDPKNTKEFKYKIAREIDRFVYQGTHRKRVNRFLKEREQSKAQLQSEISQALKGE